jgi:hypothetical protein
MCGLDHIPVILQAAENGNPVCFDNLRDYLQHYPCIRDSYAAHNPNAALVEWDPLGECCELVEYVNQNGLLAELRGRRITDAEYQHFRSLHKTQSAEHAL